MINAEPKCFTYKLLHCRCGGVIGDLSGRGDIDMLRCDRCRKVYLIYKLDYDTIFTNQKKGWIFPVKYREVLK